MSTLTIAIIVVFVLGYALIAMESLTKVNKAAIALLMFVFCWMLFMFDPAPFIQLMHPDFAGAGEKVVAFANSLITEHLGDTATTLFFLMGAMTIVEIVDQNGGFNWVKNVMQSKTKRSLLWKIAFMTFFLSAILDNLTTSIVMIMILRKLIQDKHDRMIYASLVIIAANSGGAFSPIGDVTTIMLWNSGMITAGGVISEIFVPSLISMLIPAFLLSLSLKGNIQRDNLTNDLSGDREVLEFNSLQRKIIFAIGVGGLCFVPLFHFLTDLPPFAGILLVLGVLWTVTELFYHNLHKKRGGDVHFSKRVSSLLSRIDMSTFYHNLHKERGGDFHFSKRVSSLLSRIDMSTILFFLGILMAVACLEEVGVLRELGNGLNIAFNSNHYAVTGIIGVLSSIVDNVPLVAGSMGMYPVEAMGDMAVDGIFWQLLAYCAGVGGSMLIVGSAAGVVVMGLEKITFGWYMKRISWIAFVGYIAGILSYWVIRTLIFTTPL